jgi:hypothetical protein
MSAYAIACPVTEPAAVDRIPRIGSDVAGVHDFHDMPVPEDVDDHVIQSLSSALEAAEQGQDQYCIKALRRCGLRSRSDRPACGRICEASSGPADQRRQDGIPGGCRSGVSNGSSNMSTPTCPARYGWWISLRLRG